MRLQKQAQKNMALEESIKRLKNRGKNNSEIAKELGITENRVNDILQRSLNHSRLVVKNLNEKAQKEGLSVSDYGKKNLHLGDKSAELLSALAKKYDGTETEIVIIDE